MFDEETKAQAESEKPKQETKPDGDRELQSRLHRRTAEAEKKATAAVKERDELTQRVAEAEATLRYLRESGASDETLEERAKALAILETKAAAQRQKDNETVQQAARHVSLRYLKLDFPDVPPEVYEGKETVEQMELAAHRYDREQRLSKSDKTETLAKPRAEEGVEPAKVDMGEAYVPGKSWKDMTDEEYRKESKKLEDAARSRALKRP